MADPGLLALFVIATFLGALVAGLAGFAFGLIAAAIWLHILTPLQAATLIVCYGLIVQGYAVWKLRHALDWQRLLPMMIGGQLGIPLGGAGCPPRTCGLRSASFSSPSASTACCGQSCGPWPMPGHWRMVVRAS